MNKRKYYIFTLGCQMNESDSERLMMLLEKAGYQLSDELEADLIVVNACSVRQKPIDRIWGKLRLWQKHNPSAKTILTGCLTDHDRKKFEEEFDLVFSVDNVDQFSDLLELEGSYQEYLDIRPKYKNQDKAFVPIMTGCNNFCSYCVVPYTRGRERSRKAGSVIREIKQLIKDDYKKIVLLGQNVNSYHDKSSGEDFIRLLQKIVALEGDFKVEFLTSHPKDMANELIELVGKEKKLSNWIHLPVQSGDNQILKRMNRGYTSSKYLSLIKKIKDNIKNPIITTDIIVGFPGESNGQFNNTLKLAKQAKFDQAFIAQYSPRPGTKAWLLEDDISREEKKRRWQILDDLINKKRTLFKRSSYRRE